MRKSWWPFRSKSANEAFHSNISLIDHLSINVPSIEEAIAFFGNVLGGCVEFRTGSFYVDKYMAISMALPENLKVIDHCMVSFSGKTRVSIFEFDRQNDEIFSQTGCSLNAFHLAFVVRSTDQAIKHLKNHNVQMMGDTLRLSHDANKGILSTYFRAPWGLLIEFIEYT